MAERDNPYTASGACCLGNESERASFIFPIRGNRFDQRGLKIELDRNIYSSSSVTGAANDSHGREEEWWQMMLLMMLPFAAANGQIE